MKKVIYIAGPFRGPSHWDIAQNIRRAEALALQVWRLGHVALCPHANTGHFQDAAPDEVWLQGDLELLRRCDAVLLTPDWLRSAGARAEFRFAESLGIPCFLTLDGLKPFLDSPTAYRHNTTAFCPVIAAANAAERTPRP